MSWIDELYNIYERNYGRSDLDPPMLPLYHSTANAQIELVIKENGDFITAGYVDKKEAVTVIPVTNDSATRSSGISPHPLADKLVYIAGDYVNYIQYKKDKLSEYYEAYISQLKKWAGSEYGHPAVRAVFSYISKGRLINDLIGCGIFEIDDAGMFKSGVKISDTPQEQSFVRFKVSYSDLMHETRTWKDKSLYDCFINYNSTRMEDAGLCYATGKNVSLTYKNPAKIRHGGDKGKLISANEDNGFSYLGRFDKKEQAFSIGYEFSQKMHNGLKWLISRQGVQIDTLMLVVWESSLRDVPNITKPADSLWFDEDEDFFADTYPAYGDLLKKSIFGYKNNFDFSDIASKTMVMGLDSATTGRLSIVVYSELPTSDFLANIVKWHEGTAWFRFNGKKQKNVLNSFGLKEIAELAFGTEQGDFIKCKPEVLREYVCRLIPCVTEGRNIPINIVGALVNRASSPLKYKNEYNWRKVLEAACGMLRKQKTEKKEECGMALDETCRSRDYLYGRLLAVADVAEHDAFDSNDNEKRTTNAKRYFEAFSNRPFTTWEIIYNRLQPYLNKLGGGSVRYEKLINEITDMFDREKFTDNSKLNPEYLHAYSCQVKKLYTKTVSDNKEE